MNSDLGMDLEGGDRGTFSDIQNSPGSIEEITVNLRGLRPDTTASALSICTVLKALTL
jgi:hypothetical protein